MTASASTTTSFAQTLWRDLAAVRTQAPLVHNITNLVVTAFTANALLAAGASPIMAHATEEVDEMVGIASSVVINIGTLDAHWVPAMQQALDAAHRLGKPSVLDPVGAGASGYRNRVLADLLQRKPGVVRGNASEILSLTGLQGQTKGVDSTAAAESAVQAAQQLAARYGCVVCVSGEQDHVIAPDGRWAVLKNGHPLMTRVTGMGCAASALIGAVLGVQLDAWQATTAAMAWWGVVGEIAAQRNPAGGTGSFATAVLDVASTLQQDDFCRTLQYEVRA